MSQIKQVLGFRVLGFRVLGFFELPKMGRLGFKGLGFLGIRQGNATSISETALVALSNADRLNSHPCHKMPLQTPF